MPRAPNPTETITVTLSMTAPMKRYLELLIRRGTFGKTVAEAAVLVVRDAMERDLKANDPMRFRVEELFEETFREDAPPDVNE